MAQTRSERLIERLSAPPYHEEMGWIEQYAGNGHFELGDDRFIELLCGSIKEEKTNDALYQDGTRDYARAMRKHRPKVFARLTDRLRKLAVWVPDWEKFLDLPDDPDSLTLPVPQSGTTLLQKHFPPPFFFIDRLLCQGLTLLAGKSKRGKTYCCLDMATAVSFGWLAFKHLPTQQCKVLFASLEDGEILVQENLHKIHPTLTELPHLDFLYEFPRMGEGALEWLKRYLETYDLIFLDILGRILPSASGTRKNMSDYQLFTDFLGPIHDLVRDSEKAIVITDHLRKAPSDDEFDEIAGSMAKIGVADHVMLYKRNIEEKDASLRIMGKRIAHHRVVVTYVDEPCLRPDCRLAPHGHLEFVGEGEAYETKTETRKILTVLTEEGRPLHTREIVQALGLPPTQYDRIRMRLTRMQADGDIGRIKAKGLWKVHGLPEEDEVPL